MKLIQNVCQLILKANSSPKRIAGANYGEGTVISSPRLNKFMIVKTIAVAGLVTSFSNHRKSARVL